MTIRVSVYIGIRILLQFKVTRRHLSLYFCQFSFTFAVNFCAQLNQFNYRNVEIFRNPCAYSRRFDVISMSGYFVLGYPVNGYTLKLPISCIPSLAIIKRDAFFLILVCVS